MNRIKFIQIDEDSREYNFYYRSIKIVKKSIFEYINFLSRVFLILKKDNFDQMQCPPRKIFSGIQENLL